MEFKGWWESTSFVGSFWKADNFSHPSKGGGEGHLKPKPLQLRRWHRDWKLLQCCLPEAVDSSRMLSSYMSVFSNQQQPELSKTAWWISAGCTEASKNHIVHLELALQIFIRRNSAGCFVITSQLVQKGGEVEWPFIQGHYILLNQGIETELLTISDHQHTSVSC